MLNKQENDCKIILKEKESTQDNMKAKVEYIQKKSI